MVYGLDSPERASYVAGLEQRLGTGRRLPCRTVELCRARRRGKARSVTPRSFDLRIEASTAGEPIDGAVAKATEALRDATGNTKNQNEPPKRRSGQASIVQRQELRHADDVERAEQRPGKDAQSADDGGGRDIDARI